MIEKTINLVYEAWDGDEPIVNGEKNFKEFFFFDSKNLFETHIMDKNGRKDHNERKLSLKRCKIEDIKKTPNEKFFCIVSSPFLTSRMILENGWDFFVSDSTLELLKEYDNFFFILTVEHEPAEDAEIDSFKKLCLMRGLPLNKFYFFNNNSLSNLLTQKYGIEVKKMNFIDYSSTEALSEIDNVEFVEDKIGKFFMSRNKTGKRHRLNLLFHLIINNIIDDVNYSKLFTYHKGDDQPYQLSLERDVIMEHLDLIDDLNQRIKEDDYEMGKGYYNYENNGFTIHYENPQSRLHYPELKESYENTYVNIVTESGFDSQDFNQNVVHITEKSFRPFYYYQIPLILATPNHIKTLKEKYDFDFFEDVINHSYDSELNDKKRFLMFFDEIKRIYNNKDEIKFFYKNNRQRFESNKKKLLEIALDKTEDFNLFWDLI
jgi:hypothetical protein